MQRWGNDRTPRPGERDGENSEHWDACYHRVGDACRDLLQFVSLLKESSTACLETWEEGFLP
jgi:hypothetical protein